MLRGFWIVFVLLGTTTPAFAQLPPEILVDRYLLQADQRTDQEDHEGALESLQKILNLQKEHELTLPEEFHFQYARVAFSAGSIRPALESVKKYLTLAGRKGEHYRDALRLLDSAEEKLQQIEAKRKRIEAARRRAEALQKENTDQAQRQIKTAAEPLPRDPLRSGGLGPEMVTVASGRFQYYARGEFGLNLQWVVFDRPFAIGKYEVTRGEFEKFVKDTRYRTEAERDPKLGCLGLNMSRSPKNSKWKWNRPGFDQADTHPVTCVSTRDAMAYAEWLSRETGHNYRVPSAAQWQYAYRAGSRAAMLFDEPDDEPDVCRHGNVEDSSTGERYAFACTDGARHTADVGQFTPNPVGLYDMVGNVAELVLACSSSPDPVGAADGRWIYPSNNPVPEHPDSCDEFVTVLGSSWNTGSTWTWDYRTFGWMWAKPYRGADKWGYRNSVPWVGFRVVKDLPVDPEPK